MDDLFDFVDGTASAPPKRAVSPGEASDAKRPRRTSPPANADKGTAAKGKSSTGVKGAAKGAARAKGGDKDKGGVKGKGRGKVQAGNRRVTRGSVSSAGSQDSDDGDDDDDDDGDEDEDAEDDNDADDGSDGDDDGDGDDDSDGDSSDGDGSGPDAPRASRRTGSAGSSDNEEASAESSAGSSASTSDSEARMCKLAAEEKHEGERRVLLELAESADGKACSHEIVYPPDFDPAVAEANKNRSDVDYGGVPARVYPFELDPFQKESIKAIENGESVMVSAHTSAGKTAVAEYAIAMCLRNKSRVIYTSPLKALSNQKYRDLLEIFGDVGLMTGDVTISPSASCLVMTAEILRSMLYRGSEVMREVQVVIMDETHYLADKERGVVWEETIILLPEKVHYVFLSATVPNAPEFAAWIAKIHHQPVHVVYTEFRPTPLQHYIYPSGGEGVHLVVDEKGDFREDNFQRALSVLAPDPLGEEGDASTSKKRKKQTKGGPSEIYKIVKMIMERKYEPVIVFGFARKECERMASQMAKLDVQGAEEKKLVEEVFKNAIQTLSEEDRKLPQIQQMLPLLRRGIGIHHSGLLPILKEVIEILFQENLLKCLFATETFSIGLNMPARTVVFTSLRKFDGEKFRWVSSGEYIQMSGRAGRRGLDDRGIVIMMLDEKMEPDVCKGMLRGKADVLRSSFHLSYNMLLNLMRVDEIRAEDLLQKSFLQFQNQRALPELHARRRQLERARLAVEVPHEAECAAFLALERQITASEAEIHAVVTKPVHIVPFLQPGRLVKVVEPSSAAGGGAGADWGWGAVVCYTRRARAQQHGGTRTEAGIEHDQPSQYVLDVLLACNPDQTLARPEPPQPGATEPAAWHVVPVVLTALNAISSIRVLMPSDIRPPAARTTVSRAVGQVRARFPTGVPTLDPIEDMGISSDLLAKELRRISVLRAELASTAFSSKDVIPVEAREEALAGMRKKNDLAAEIKTVRGEIKTTESVVMLSSLRRMKRVLRQLGYAGSDGVITTKGRFACEVSTADELLTTELVFSGAFNDLTPALTAALASCLVYQEKADENAKLKQELELPFRGLKDTARAIAKVCVECKIELDVEEYVASYKPDLMEVVHRWCQGANFAEIMSLTDIFEGSVVRNCRRLDELLRQLSQAATSIGNTQLAEQFAQASTLLARGVIFSASLYL